MIIGIPLGLYAELRPQSPLAKLLMAGRILGFSLPTFWVGLMLIMVFAVQLGWLPSSGRGATVTLLHAQWLFLTLDGWQHLILLAINLSLVMRLTRAGVQEVLSQDYIRYTRACGLTETRVIGVHVLKKYHDHGGDGEHFRLARYGQTHHRQYQCPRPANHGGVSDDDRAGVYLHQFAGEYHLFAARSARAAQCQRKCVMATLTRF